MGQRDGYCRARVLTIFLWIPYLEQWFPGVERAYAERDSMVGVNMRRVAQICLIVSLWAVPALAQTDQSQSPLTQPVPTQTRPDPIQIQPDPTQTQPDPTQTQSVPPQTQNVPPETQTVPPETQTDPPQTKTDPIQIQTDPSQTQTAPSQTQTAPSQSSATTDPNQNKAPQHTHTGWSTLFKDSVGDFVAFPRRRSTWVLVGIGGAAGLATPPADDSVEAHLVGNDTATNIFKLGKWIGSSEVQIGSAVGLWVVGRYIVAPAADESRTNKWSEVGFDLIRAQILSQALVAGIKESVRRDRPTGECCAFPSGHAATAFAAASVLERHFGYRASWPALVAATYVGASRLVDDRHFLSDVMFGAGLGVASGWTGVGTRGRRSQFALQPVPLRGGMLIAFTRVQPEG